LGLNPKHETSFKRYSNLVSSPAMNIHYVTSNSGKFAEAKHIFSRDNSLRDAYTFVHSAIHLDELQGSLQQIIKHKLDQAYNYFKEPCVVDDGALFCDAIGGLPGPYIRPFLEAVSDVGLWELIERYENRSCQVVCLIGFLENHVSPPQIFEGRVSGTIVAPRGGRKLSLHSWSTIVQPHGCEHTFAEMSLEEASLFSARNKALLQFREYLIRKKI
jgi:inosine triphosphate pyrophosphatase